MAIPTKFLLFPDFGKGFYTTTSLEQAMKWAVLKKNREQAERAIRKLAYRGDAQILGQ